MHSYDIVGYTYRADIYCEQCIAVMFEREDDDAPSIFKGAEAILNDEANRRRIEREDEHTFDSDNFPKVIFADMDENDSCANCHEKLIGD